MRGRVMALWALAWLGSTPIGGLPTLLCGILALPALARIDRRRTRDETPAAPAQPDSVLSPSR